MRTILCVLGALLVGALAVIACLVPNPLWSSRALVAVLGKDTLLQFTAKEVLLRRVKDREIIVPALVRIAGGCDLSTEDIYYNHPRLAVSRLCVLKDPSAVPLLLDERRKRQTQKCDSLHNPDAESHITAALRCLGVSGAL